MTNMMITKDATQANAITHGGSFHADEVMATALLLRIHPGLVIARVPNMEGIPADFKGIVYDIGYGEFDHHQDGKNGKRDDGIPYASAGLIWKKYGIQILQDAHFSDIQDGFDKIDRELIEPIDARDNGISYNGDVPMHTFSDIVESMNPVWNEETNTDEGFVRAVHLAEKVLERKLVRERSRQEAEYELNKELRYAKDGILLLHRYLPWKEFAGRNPLMKDIYFVIFPSQRGGYNIQCVPPDGKPMEQKKPIPKELRGKTADEYAKAGLKGIIFVHNAGFMAAADTEENALAFAKYLNRIS